MYSRIVLAAMLALGLLAAPVAAFDVTSMTDEERASFRAEIRAYLLDNPEVLMEAISVLESREREAQAASDIELVRSNSDQLFNDETSWTGGNPDGDVTIVEFMDYRCGYCRRAFEEVETLVSTDDDIRFILKEFPILGEQSERASRYAISVRQVAGDTAYKNVHDALMTMRSDVTMPALARLSDGFGLDHGAIVETMDSRSVTDVITRNRALADALSITGTPTFVIETQLVRGYVPLNQMQQVVAALRDPG